jgi:hypothetical protein
MRFLPTAALVAIVAGCASSGVKVTDAQLAQFTRGKTTLAEVLAALGPPTSRMRANDGSTMLQYVAAQASVRPASFIPVVGMIAGGSDIKSSVVALRFDQKDVLLTIDQAESQYGTGMGGSATTTQQPR